ncbi:MAG: hypothetical protein ACXWAT_00890 [Methylobacter sp.]
MIVLTVVEPFGGYEKGAIISDPKEMAAVLDSENQGHVVRTNQPDAPAKTAA